MTPELEQEIRAEFEKWCAEHGINPDFSPVEKAFLAGRASALGKLEQVGRVIAWKPLGGLVTVDQPHETNGYPDPKIGAKVFRLTPEIEKEIQK